MQFGRNDQSNLQFRPSNYVITSQRNSSNDWNASQSINERSSKGEDYNYTTQKDSYLGDSKLLRINESELEHHRTQSISQES